MNKLHMIWIGNPKNHIQNVTMLLKSICENHFLDKRLKGRIIFWCEKRYEENLKNIIQSLASIKFSESISRLEVRCVDSYLSVPALGSIKENSKTETILTNDVEKGILYVYTKLKDVIPVAAKDLIAQYIMWKFGGIFLDTTTRIVSPEAFLQQLDDSYKNHKVVPVVYDNAQTYINYPKIKNALTSEDPGIIFDVGTWNGGTEAKTYDNNLECWALKSSEKTKYINGITLGRLMRLWESIFIETNISREQQNLINQIISDGQSEARQNLIGSTIIYSLYEGLKKVIINESNNESLEFDVDKGLPYNVENFCWLAVKGVDDKNISCVMLPELGVNKYYRGTWRK